MSRNILGIWRFGNYEKRCKMIKQNIASGLEYIDSKPTKEFFVQMITRDVTLVSAILDLIDNSIDAIKMEDNGNEKNISIEIEYDTNEFSISDNCGGLSKENAKNYAFDFGRDNIEKSGSIGRFGIGMKRSIFKMGNRFEVISKTKEDNFRVYDDLNEWLERKTISSEQKEIPHWAFLFEDNIETPGPEGTKIIIKQLHPGVVDIFSTEKFKIELCSSISKAYASYLEKGVKIIINSEVIRNLNQDLLVKRSVLGFSYESGVFNQVGYQIISGVNSPDPELAGWSIICNERAILTANKEDITGWESTYQAENDKSIEELLKIRKVPKYHNTFARFRGYLILKSEDSDRLPYNTTKDNVEFDSEIYQFLLPKMKRQMLYTFEYLRDLNKKDEQSQLLREKLKLAELKKIDELMDRTSSKMFSYSQVNSAGERLTALTIKKPISIVKKLKKYTKITKNEELAEYIYNYFITMEGLNE